MMRGVSMSEDLTALIVGTLREHGDARAITSPVELGTDTPLFGREGMLDSLGLVALVPLYLSARAMTPANAFFYGWLTGLIVNLYGFSWGVGLAESFAHVPRPWAGGWRGKVSGIDRTRVGHQPNTCRGSPEDETSEINRTNTTVGWAGQGSNLRPKDYESSALTTELPAQLAATRRAPGARLELAT